jgi:hypothetical protein
MKMKMMLGEAGWSSATQVVLPISDRDTSRSRVAFISMTYS